MKSWQEITDLTIVKKGVTQTADISLATEEILIRGGLSDKSDGQYGCKFSGNDSWTKPMKRKSRCLEARLNR